jgi:hypothetical protein
MMRAHVRFASVFVLGAAFSVGCGGGSGGTGEDIDSGTEDSSIDSGGSEVDVDTGTDPDTGTFEIDTGADTKPETSPETSVVDTGTDTGSADTGSSDTGTADTGPADTGPADMGVDTTPACTVGAACDEANKCMTGKTFDATCACTGGTAVVCMDTNACTVDTCEPATGCKFTNAADGTTCGAGKKCTAGACSDLCTVGADCDDANACTTGTKFDATCACVGGTAVVCNDSNPCTADSCVPATGCATTPTAEGTSPTGCAAPSTCKAGVCTAPLAPPTITFTTPADNITKGFVATSDTCNGLDFTVVVTAPAKIATVSWHLFTPTRDGSSMTGSDCGAPTSALAPWRSGLGNPKFPFKIDESKYAGLTGGTFTENIGISGNYSGVAPWLFCKEPGTGGTAFATALNGTAIPPVSTAAGALRALSNYCFTTDSGGTAADKKWTLIVMVRDQAGNTVQAERKFTVYKI